MATIYNNTSLKKAINELKLAPAREKIANETSDKIVLTYSINNPYTIKSASTSCTNATSATIMTTATNADTYITNAVFGLIKDVTATSTLSTLSLTHAEGPNASIISIPGLSLTPQDMVISSSYVIPIKVARGTVISLSNTTNVGNITSRGTVQYFEVPD